MIARIRPTLRSGVTMASGMQQQLTQIRSLQRPAINTSQLTEGRRTGALAMKVGMLGVWDKWGVRYPVTVLHVDGCRVVQTKSSESEGYCALQLGVGEAKIKRVSKPMLGHFQAANTNTAASASASDRQQPAVNRRLEEFRVSPDCALPPGTPIYATHFVPGQLVDVCGVSKGKGFQGVMKRHNFAGGRASHGNSLNHRTPGSTGCRQDPGKVFKGKKMPGRMGGDRKTVQNMRILKIDVTRDLLYVHGCVPGQKGAFIRVTDAVKGPFYPPSAVSAEGPHKPAPFLLSDNAYTPYTLPLPTMTAEQRGQLVQHLQDKAAAGSGAEAPVVSLWASTAGVSRAAGQQLNVDVGAAAVAAEIDPGKGVEVSDPYAL